MRATRTHRGVPMLKGNGEPKAAVKAAAKTSIFENLQREALLQLHPRRAQQGANRLGRSALAANDFSQVLGVHAQRSEEHTSELQSRGHLVCRLLLEKKKKNK